MSFWSCLSRLLDLIILAEFLKVDMGSGLSLEGLLTLLGVLVGWEGFNLLEIESITRRLKGYLGVLTSLAFMLTMLQGLSLP